MAASDTASCSSVSLKSIRLPSPPASLPASRRLPCRRPRRHEHGQRQLLVVVDEGGLHGHADPNGIELHAVEVGDQPRPLLQLDEADRQRVLEGRHLRVVHDDVRVHRAAAARLHRVPLQRAAHGAGRQRRVAQRAARGAVLNQQLVRAGTLEPERVVLREGGVRARRPGRLLHRRQELEDAEAHGGHGLPGVVERLHLVVRRRPHRHVGVGDGHVVEPGGDEAPRAQPGALRIRDRLDDGAHQQPVADHQGPVVVLLAVGGDDRGQALVIEQGHHLLVRPAPLPRRPGPGPPRSAARRAGRA